MTSRPLTHHEILALVEPFTRRGRHVDLAASNRMERRLLFKPVEHGDPVPAPLNPMPNRPHALTETLQLEQPEPGIFVLTRTLTAPGGLQARLQATGPQAGELLAHIDTISPQSQFCFGPGFVISHSHRLEAAPLGAPVGETAPTEQVRRVLTQGTAQVDGFSLVMKLPAVQGYPAEISLLATAAGSIELPPDLLAVLGWGWSRLDRAGPGWASTLRLRGKEPERSRGAERQLEATVRHLARTLAEPPARFHTRLAAARWGVALRHAMPLLTVAGLIGAALAVPRLEVGGDSPFRMLVFNGPPLLLALGVCLKEMPRFEIPRFPRPSRALAWRSVPPPESNSTPVR